MKITVVLRLGIKVRLGHNSAQRAGMHEAGLRLMDSLIHRGLNNTSKTVECSMDDRQNLIAKNIYSQSLRLQLTQPQTRCSDSAQPISETQPQIQRLHRLFSNIFIGSKSPFILFYFIYYKTFYQRSPFFHRGRPQPPRQAQPIFQHL